MLREIADLRKATYGFTAQQIIAKIEKDSGAEAILSHLIKETKEREIEKLLVSLFPKAYTNAQITQIVEELPYPQLLSSLSTCYRIVFDHASNPVKKAAVSRFVEMLRTEATETIHTYEEAFFRAPDLEFVEPVNVPIVRDHLLARFNDSTKSMIPIIRGIGRYLEPGESHKLIDPVVRGVRASAFPLHFAIELLESEKAITSAAFHDAALERLRGWENAYIQRKQPDGEKFVREMMVPFLDLPF